MDAALAFLMDQFQRVHRNKRVFSFVEAKSTSLRRGHRRVLVCSHETSVLGLPQEIVVPICASHNSITKFKSPHDANYATFYRHLASALREIRSHTAGPLIPPPPYSPPYLPHWVPPNEVYAAAQERRRYVPGGRGIMTGTRGISGARGMTW